MKDISTSVESLHIKVDQLIRLHSRAEEARKKLQVENQALSQQLEAEKAKVKDLTERTKVMSLAKALPDKGENSLELKLKINELVREIDKCLAYLNR